MDAHKETVIQPGVDDAGPTCVQEFIRAHELFLRELRVSFCWVSYPNRLPV
jgi:hypothetical protein